MLHSTRLIFYTDSRIPYSWKAYQKATIFSWTFSWKWLWIIFTSKNSIFTNSHNIYHKVAGLRISVHCQRNFLIERLMIFFRFLTILSDRDKLVSVQYKSLVTKCTHLLIHLYICEYLYRTIIKGKETYLMWIIHAVLFLYFQLIYPMILFAMLLNN